MTGDPREVDRYAVIGYPVSHSWSPFIHGLFARQTGQSMSYRLLEVPPELFRQEVLAFFASGGKGLNVTLPHKQAAADIANRLTPRATLAKAANTLLFAGQEILADNTDGVGLVADLRGNLGFDITDRTVLLLGAGGACRGVIGPLLEAGARRIEIANRRAARAVELAAEFAQVGDVVGGGFDMAAGRHFDLLINATASSLQGETPPIDPAVIGPRTVCYDLAYGKGQTAFTAWAARHGAARAVQGWGMLVEQAAESFLLWRGVRPQTAPVLAALQLQFQPQSGAGSPDD